jgi:hypothetical protein
MGFKNLRAAWKVIPESGPRAGEQRGCRSFARPCRYAAADVEGKRTAFGWPPPPAPMPPAGHSRGAGTLFVVIASYLV